MSMRAGWRRFSIAPDKRGAWAYGRFKKPCCAGIGAAVEHRANDIGLAAPGIAMLAEVGVEAKRLVVLALDQSFALEEIDRKDRRVAAVAAAKGQGAALKIGKRGDRPAGDRNDPGRPAHVRIAHRDRSATVVAPGIGLDKSEVRIPF